MYIASEEIGMLSKIRNGIIMTKAISRLEAGPAKDVQMTPVRGFRIRFGLMGTGFAQPNPVNNSKIAPKGSTWEKGFRVSLPFESAVSSPQRRATQACANSCNGKTSRMMMTRAMSIMRICCLLMESKFITWFTSYF